MPKVLTIIQTPVYGGPHNCMLNTAKPLLDRGWESTVILPTENGTGRERLSAAGIPTVQTPIHRLRAKINPMVHLETVNSFFPEVSVIENLIREQQPDVVQICGLMSLHGGVAAKRQDVPIVWQILGTFAPPPLRQVLSRYVQGAADVVMTTGKKIAQIHTGITKLGDRVIPFYPPVDTERFRPDMEQRLRARAELGVPEGSILIGTVGNRCRPKAHERMVEAFAYLQKRYDNLHFRILGGHTPSNAVYYQREVMDRAKRLGLFNTPQFQLVEPGHRVPELLPAFDIFALTSRAEGIPTVVLEAMACGVPVVAMEVGGVAEVVMEGVTGFVVPSTNPTVFAQTVAKLIEDSSLRLQMEQNSRQQALAKFSIMNCVDLHIQAYDMALRHHQHA